MVHQYPGRTSTRVNSPPFSYPQLQYAFSQELSMSQPSKEARLLLAVQAFQRNPKKKLRVLTRYYTMPYSTLQKRVQGQLPLSERRLAMHKLTEIEEKVILQRVIDLDTRGFSPRLSGVEEIANLIL